MTKNEKILKKELLLLSVSNNWEIAKKEWELIDTYYDYSLNNNCTCSKRNIKEVCVIQNKLTHNTAIVGNECIKKFLHNVQTDGIFDSIRAVMNNDKGSLTLNFLQSLYAKKIFTETELFFYKDIRNKKKLNLKQQNWKIRLNDKFMNNYIKNGYNIWNNRLQLLLSKQPNNNFFKGCQTHLLSGKYLSYKQTEKLLESYYNYL